MKPFLLARTGALFLALLSSPPALRAAPIPATSSSSLISSEKGLFLSSRGFSINAGETAWIHTQAPRGIPTIATVYRAPETSEGVQAALTVRIDELNSKSTLKGYVKSWIKDYHRLGFDVLSAKPIQVDGQLAFLLDTLNQETKKQLRQVVFLKEKTAVILSCRDHKNTFQNNVQACNRIIRTFKWSL